jgi:hypothetical protein
MNSKRQNILSCFTKAIVLPLYVSFFIVQLFFNFDIANHSSNNPFFAPYKITTHRSSSVDKTNKGKSVQQTIRLNKRFEPQTVPAYNNIVIKSPVDYLDKNNYVSYAAFIPASFLLPQSFRGPPVVA